MSGGPAGPRLVSEPLGSAHLDEVWPWEADERVARWMWPGELGGPRTREQSTDLLHRLAATGRPDGTGYRLWRRRADGVAVARGGIAPTTVDGQPAMELAWLVDPDAWGRGYASEIGAACVAHARRLCLPEVVAYTLPGNVASRRVMEKLGMSYVRDFEHAGLAHVLYVLALR